MCCILLSVHIPIYKKRDTMVQKLTLVSNTIKCNSNSLNALFFISQFLRSLRSVLRPARRVKPSAARTDHPASLCKPQHSSSTSQDAVAGGHPFLDQERCDRSRHVALKHKELTTRFLVFGDMATARHDVLGPHPLEQLAEAVL